MIFHKNTKQAVVYQFGTRPLVLSPKVYPALIGQTRLRTNKVLRPIEDAVAVRDSANTDLGIRTVQDVGTMSGGIHPCVHDRLGGGLAVCNVFSCGGIRDAELLHHVKRRAIRGRLVGKIVVVDHVFGLGPRHVGEAIVDGQCGQPVCCALLVDQCDDRLLRGAQSGDIHS